MVSLETMLNLLFIVPLACVVAVALFLVLATTTARPQGEPERDRSTKSDKDMPEEALPFLNPPPPPAQPSAGMDQLASSSRIRELETELHHANDAICRLKKLNHNRSDQLRRGGQHRSMQQRTISPIDDFESLVLELPDELSKALISKHKERINHALYRQRMDYEKQMGRSDDDQRPVMRPHVEALDAWKRQTEAEYNKAVSQMQHQAEVDRSMAVAAVKQEAEARFAEAMTAAKQEADASCARAVAAALSEAQAKYEGKIKHDRALRCVRLRRRAKQLQKMRSAPERFARSTKPIATAMDVVPQHDGAMEGIETPVVSHDVGTQCTTTDAYMAECQRAMETQFQNAMGERDANHQLALQEMAALHQKAISELETRHQQSLAAAKSTERKSDLEKHYENAKSIIANLRRQLEEKIAQHRDLKCESEKHRQEAEDMAKKHLEAVQEIRQLKRCGARHAEKIASLERALADQASRKETSTSDREQSKADRQLALEETHRLRQVLECTVAEIEGVCSSVEAALRSLGREIVTSQVSAQRVSSLESKAPEAIGWLKNVLDGLHMHHNQLSQDQQRKQQTQYNKVVQERDSLRQECSDCQEEMQALRAALSQRDEATKAREKARESRHTVETLLAAAEVASVKDSLARHKAQAEKKHRHTVDSMERHSAATSKMAEAFEELREKFYSFQVNYLSSQSQLDEFNQIMDDIMALCNDCRDVSASITDDLSEIRVPLDADGNTQKDELDELEQTMNRLLSLSEQGANSGQ